MIIAIITSFFRQKDYRFEPFLREKRNEAIIIINPISAYKSQMYTNMHECLASPFFRHQTNGVLRVAWTKTTFLGHGIYL
jgi:hypothetical protein